MSFQTVLDIINAMPAEVWETLVAALFLSPFMLGIKKWFNVNREALMMFLVIGGAVITAAIAYIQNTPDFAPWLIIPLQGLITFALSQPAYYLIVKPLRNKVREMIAEAEQLNEAKRSAAIPADTVSLK